jgi:ankyrin repeat protein
MSSHATSLYYAASSGLDATVRALIASSADANAPGSRFGGTAFHADVLREHIGVMDILVKAGADPNQADWQGISPMYSAMSYDNTGLIQWLLMHRAQPLREDYTGTLFGAGLSNEPEKIPASKEAKGSKSLPLPAHGSQSAHSSVSRDGSVIFSLYISIPKLIESIGAGDGEEEKAKESERKRKNVAMFPEIFHGQTA